MQVMAKSYHNYLSKQLAPDSPKRQVDKPSGFGHNLQPYPHPLPTFILCYFHITVVTTPVLQTVAKEVAVDDDQHSGSTS